MRTPPHAALLLAAAAALVSGQGMYFKASELQDRGFSVSEKALGPYYIPDQQCSGVVYNLTGACRYVSAVRVLAVDAHGYPEISIEGPLRRATVRRRGGGARGCRGALPVHVLVGCAPGEEGAPRSSRAAPPAPPAPWGPLPPMPPMPPAPRADSML